MQSHDIGEENIKNDNFFRCEICVIWFNDIDELFLHILEEHPHIEVFSLINLISLSFFGDYFHLQLIQTEILDIQRHARYFIQTMGKNIENGKNYYGTSF